MLDQLNIVYVAMTRPVERLDVLAKPPNWNLTAPIPRRSVNGFLRAQKTLPARRSFRTGMPFFTARMTEDRWTLRAGTPFRGRGDDAPQLGEASAQRVVMPEAHPSQVHPDGLDEAALGTLVHNLLAEVKEHADWDRVRTRFKADGR